MRSSKVLSFILLLGFISSLLLAVTSYALSGPQKVAKEFDQSKQMLIAAKILNHQGFFQLLQEDGTLCEAIFDSKEKILVKTDDDQKPKLASEEEIKEIAKARIRALLTDDEGAVFTLDQKKVDLPTYLSENKKTGYATQKNKLLYAILPNEKKSGEVTEEMVSKDLCLACGFVVPVSGFGLWAPIYGYIAIHQDGDHVIGTTWYEHGETPGLGANITEPWWQNQFYNKVIFQESGSGEKDTKTTPMGIIVVKGKVQDVYGSSPKAKSAVDGMSGATLTGDGVTGAYKASLTPYRNFFLKLEKSHNG